MRGSKIQPPGLEHGAWAGCGKLRATRSSFPSTGTSAGWAVPPVTTTPCAGAQKGTRAALPGASRRIVRVWSHFSTPVPPAHGRRHVLRRRGPLHPHRWPKLGGAARTWPRTGLGPVAERVGDLGGPLNDKLDHAGAVVSEHLPKPADRQRGRDDAAVVEDRRAKGHDAGGDILIGDRVATLARGAQLSEERRTGGGGARRAALERRRVEIRAPGAFGLERQQQRGAAPRWSGSEPPRRSSSSITRAPSIRSMHTASSPRRTHRNTVSPVTSCRRCMTGSAEARSS